MNKDEFLRQLEVLLSGISQEERTEALAFYRSYFEDAGEANEAKILEELESPQKVADSIIKDLGVQPGEACSSGAQGASAGAEWNPAVQGAAQNAAYSTQEKDGMPGWAIVLLVITSPVWLVMILVILSALLGIVAALFGIAIAVVAVMGALLICGVVLFVHLQEILQSESGLWEDDSSCWRSVFLRWCSWSGFSEDFCHGH